MEKGLRYSGRWRSIPYRNTDLTWTRRLPCAGHTHAGDPPGKKTDQLPAPGVRKAVTDYCRSSWQERGWTMTPASWQRPLPPWVLVDQGGFREPCRRLGDVLAWPGHSYTTTEDHHGSLCTKKPWPTESNNIHLGCTQRHPPALSSICPRHARRERGSWGS